MSIPSAIYAREEKTLSTLLVWRELTREEPDDYRLARSWRTSLAQSEVLRGETAAVALPPTAAVRARVSRFFNEAVNSNSEPSRLK